MTTRTLETADYQLFLNPRSPSRALFEFEVFTPHPYALIDLPSFDFKGKSSLFAAHRRKDGKMGQLVTFELEADLRRFEARFTPD